MEAIMKQTFVVSTFLAGQLLLVFVTGCDHPAMDSASDVVLQDTVFKETNEADPDGVSAYVGDKSINRSQ